MNGMSTHTARAFSISLLIVGLVVSLACIAIGVAVGRATAPSQAQKACIRAIEKADATFNIIGKTFNDDERLLVAATDPTKTADDVDRASRHVADDLKLLGTRKDAYNRDAWKCDPNR